MRVIQCQVAEDRLAQEVEPHHFPESEALAPVSDVETVCVSEVRSCFLLFPRFPL